MDKAIAVRNGVIALALLVVGAWLTYEWKPEWFVASTDPVAVPDEPLSSTQADPVEQDDPGAAQNWNEITGATPRPIGAGGLAQDCASIEREWRQTCKHLDARFPIDDSYALSVELTEALSRSRPAVQGELLQHGLMLQNVFHLFRVVGAERMATLAQILEQEDLLEPVSHAFYRWISAGDRCAEGGAKGVSAEIRSEYAAYLFQTLGGQAYLRRRTPRAEALACFYAIHSIDLAQRGGKNSQGYDPRREIPRCRRLLMAERWTLEESYTERLDAIAAGWISR